MENQSEKKQFIQYLFIFFFILLLMFFQLQLFSIIFIALLGLLLFVGFLKEEYRLFLWVTCFFMIGEFGYLYGDRLLLEMNISREWKIIGARLFLLIPIFFISIVIIKFKRKLLSYRFNTHWKETIYFPYIWNGFYKLSVKKFLLYGIILNIILFSPLIGNNLLKLNPYIGLAILVFSLIQSLLEEILWRGILLTRFSALIGERWAVLFTSVAFGLAHLTFGYSLGICLLFSLGGLFYGAVTVRSKSLLPAIIWHFVFNALMILSGTIPLIVN